tara:strand:- start:653 stop:1381 length:729 start_codon:yes stop_codon:yes gene_type:complete
MSEIITRQTSIIPACDVPLQVYLDIVQATKDTPEVSGYKIGFQLGLGEGLSRVVGLTRNFTDKPVIYDHQKAGNDIHDTGKNFATTMVEGGIDNVILFPFTGPVTARAWIDAAKGEGLNVIIGGRMTHDGFARSDGGFIADEAVQEIYDIALEKGVTDFVMPGNQPEFVANQLASFQARGIDPTFYAPGFVDQGGSISETAKVAGKKWHAIAGRGVFWNKGEKRYNTKAEMEVAVRTLTSQL